MNRVLSYSFTFFVVASLRGKLPFLFNQDTVEIFYGHLGRIVTIIDVGTTKA